MVEKEKDKEKEKEKDDMSVTSLMPKIVWVLIIVIGFFLANILTTINNLQEIVEELRNSQARIETKMQATESTLDIIIGAVTRGADRQDVIRYNIEGLKQEVGQLQGAEEYQEE